MIVEIASGVKNRFCPFGDLRVGIYTFEKLLSGTDEVEN